MASVKRFVHRIPRFHLSVEVSFAGTIRDWSLQGQMGEKRRESCEVLSRREEVEVDRPTNQEEKWSFSQSQPCSRTINNIISYQCRMILFRTYLNFYVPIYVSVGWLDVH